MTEHTCTKKCLRSTYSFGRRFYYCADQAPISVPVKRWTLLDVWLAQTNPLQPVVERLSRSVGGFDPFATRVPFTFVDPLEQLEVGRSIGADEVEDFETAHRRVR